LKLSIATLSVFALSALALAGPAAADDPKTCATATVYNHRGDSSSTQAPVTENTVAASAASASYGVGMETDVWQSKDPTGPETAEFFLNHDNTWSRTSLNSTGAVQQMTPAQNRAVILKDGSTPPTLAQMLAQSEATGTPIAIELKNSMNWAQLYATITANISLDKILVESDNLSRVRAFHVAHPDVTTGFIVQKDTYDRASVASAGTVVLVPAKLITPALVTANTAAGLRTVSRVASGGAAYASVLASGADLIVEGSASYRSWCNNQP
jgi:glycerophosphoryl diester phosphodiesterase